MLCKFCCAYGNNENISSVTASDISKMRSVNFFLIVSRIKCVYQIEGNISYSKLFNNRAINVDHRTQELCHFLVLHSIPKTSLNNIHFYACVFQYGTFFQFIYYKLVSLFLSASPLYLSLSLFLYLIFTSRTEVIWTFFFNSIYCASFNAQLLVRSPLNRKLRENPSRRDWSSFPAAFVYVFCNSESMTCTGRAIMLLSDIMKWLKVCLRTPTWRESRRCIV